MNLASSYASSESFLKYDEVDLRDSRVPDAAETLPTGFRMVLDEHLAANVWSSEKQRETLQDILIKYMRREDILPNFEKMELMVIVGFHYFNLIFAKEELMLNNRKTVFF